METHLRSAGHGGGIAGGAGASPGCRTCCSTSPSSQAFLIAFTSDFLPRAYYQYVHDSSLRGYVNFTLAHTPWDFVLQSNATCRWKLPPRSCLVWLLSSFA